ncbi:MAG: dicarboxylate/amino acid:cation symporter [Bdellovibrionales bacterium]|nr:dicarboxylate/amino acid:cation symporter [Bdellovibrionales bacterium]
MLQKITTYYKQHLQAFMLVGILGGAVCGFLLPHLCIQTSLIGELFLRVLSLLVVPVIILSMLSGVLNLKGSENIARIGFKALLYYATTTALAVLVGLTLVNIIQPGTGTSPNRDKVLHEVIHTEDTKEPTSAFRLSDVARNIVPKNIIQAGAEGNVLGLIFFTVFLGIALLHVKHDGVTHVISATSALFEGVLWMIEQILLLAPIGFFSLIGSLVGEFVLEESLVQLGIDIGWYTLTVVCGLIIHGVVVLPLIASLFRIAPLPFAKAMFPALTTAFSTASSSATLPITLDALEHRAGVSNKIASFVAPLGATVNMDGTAIYEAVAVVFIANMLGVDLSAIQQVTIFLTATFSAIGAAGIPGAGLIMMVLVLNSVGLPADGIKLIVVVDRGLDMLRTCINVWGDSIGAALIARTEEQR